MANAAAMQTSSTQVQDQTHAQLLQYAGAAC